MTAKIRFVYVHEGAPMRYRVLHQAEQARLHGYQTEIVALENRAHLYRLQGCDLLYLHRVPLTSRSLPLVLMARLRGIPLVFDSDDLVWDENERSYNFLDKHYTPAQVDDILLTNRRLRAMMRWVDAHVLSTAYLRDQAQRSFQKPVFVNWNALSDEQIALGEAAYRQRRRDPSAVVIGYFCGTPHVHDEDFASITPALEAVLRQHNQVRLRLYGELGLAESLSTAFADRIERYPAVAWEQLSQHMAQIDIALAPLIDNPQRRSKSAVKYLEAALVRVATVASDLEPYNAVIENGKTGCLASDPASWQQALDRLIQSSALRERIAQAAYDQLQQQHTNRVRAAQFGQILAQLLRR